MASCKKKEDKDTYPKLSASEKVGKSKTTFVLDEPFFASIMLNMDVREDEQGELPIETMGTDGREIIYSGKFVKKLPMEQLLGVLAHEVMHIVGLHNLRRGERDPMMWNVACDLAINPIVIDAGFVLPPKALVDHQFDGMDAETIYAKMNKDKKWIDKVKAMASGGEGGGKEDPMGCGGVFDRKNKDGSEMSKAQKEVAGREQKIANEQAAQVHEKHCGSLPGFLKRMLGELNKPKVNWKEALAQFVAVNSKSDFTWIRPNQRYVAQGVYLPQVYKPEIGEVVNLIDGSGSISEKELKEEVSELQGILYAYEGVTLKVIFFDARAGDPIEVTDETEVKKINVGGFGGGTDYKPPFGKIEEKKLDPVCIICLTDGYCDSFPKAPEVPVLWVLNVKNPNFKPPFGDVIIMENVANGD
jgi:predicted metal-dependent peptidase